jgi:hypothetical protein
MAKSAELENALMPGTSITKPTTVELFIKDRADLRLDVGAITAFIAAIDGLADAVVVKAAALARAEARTTLLERDVTAGFQSVVGTPGQTVDPEAVFRELDKLNTDELAKVINLIQAWLDTRK